MEWPGANKIPSYEVSRRLKPSCSSHNKGETGTHSLRGHLLRKSGEGSPVIYVAPVERQGIGWALLEVPQPRLGREVALVVLGCAGPGWIRALDPLGWRWPREELPAAGRAAGAALSLRFGTRLVPKLSFICLTGQRKRLFTPSPCPTVTATGSACQQTFCGARTSFGLCFGDWQRKGLCTNPALDLIAWWGWVQD